MMKKRLLKKTALAMAVILGVSMGGMGTVLAGEADSTVSKEGRTEIVIWHMLSGVGEEAFTKIVNDFNASQDEYYVTSEFQGNWYDSFAKFKATPKDLCRISIRL